MATRLAVITGASSGIGRATALEFAKQGYRVAVLARRTELLDSLVKECNAGDRVCAYPCDITKWKEVESVFSTLAEQGGVHVLVNNAGAYEYSSLEKSTPEKLDHLIDVNVRGLVYVSKAALPALKAGLKSDGWAKIVNVSSISGLWGFANMSTYTATKFAVSGFSSGLRRELASTRIQVGTIYPGPVNTKGPRNGKSRKLVMMPDEVARQIFSLATNYRRNLVSHPAFSVLSALENLSPQLVDRVLKRII